MPKYTNVPGDPRRMPTEAERRPVDDMQRYRDIKANADPEDPTTTFRQTVVVACDEALVEALKLERQGKRGKVRALGFTATADYLGL